MKVHDEIEDLMAAALCDALTPEEQQNFERHIADCSHCRSLYEEDQKMNDILSTTMAEMRPDQSFEGRVIAGFRKKVLRKRFDPFRGMVWLVQLRPMQAVFAVLMLFAMVKGGALLTGERFPGEEPQNKSWAEESKRRVFNLKDRNEDSSEKEESESLKAGTGTLTLTGANTYTGRTTISGGTLKLEHATIQRQELASGPAIGMLANKQAKLGDLGFTVRNDFEARAVNGPEFTRNALAGQGGAGGKGAGGEIAKSPDAAQQLVQKIGDKAQIAARDGLDTLRSDDSRKLIRNASLEIEVDHFEKAMETVATVAGEEQGYVATQNSERGANGKLQGEVVVKMLPANLDRFLLKLRTLGELKNQTLGAEDVTKSYFDTEARLRNGNRMEERLLDMLKKNTGKVSDLLQVEKELARVREQIEQMQGQLKYFDALVAYATITISLKEKDLNQPAAYLLREHANLSLFSKDVEKAFGAAKNYAESARAQTVDSHIERDADGHVSATLRLLIAPDASDELISHVKAIGRIQNFSSQTERVANNGSKDGSGNADAAKIERDKVELNLTIQRDEEQAVQQTSLSVMTDRVEEKTAQIKQAALTAGVEVKNAVFNHDANNVEVSNINLRMPVRIYPAFLEQIKSLGKVNDFTVSRRDDAAASENAPAEIALRIYSQGNIVNDDTGIVTTIRKTLAEACAAIMWSARMIGVSLAFLAPWVIALGAVVWIVIRRKAGKSR